jgi:very-short-patch-repair endonuclease
MRGAKAKKTQLSRLLRRRSTAAESRLWHQLRSRSLGGFKFIRQEPIGPYVVDFVCRDQRLIEVDGGQHADNNRDLNRDKWLTEHNYRVLRFWNNEVLTNMNGVLEVIASALTSERPLTRSSPMAKTDLSPRAGRGDLTSVP